MRRPHGEAPGGHPADQQQLLSPFCLPAPSSRTETKPGQHTEAKPGQRIRFSRSPPSAPASPGSPPPPNHRLRTLGARWGPLRPIRLGTARSAAPPLEPRLWAERPLYDRSIRTGCGFCTTPRYQGGVTRAGGRSGSARPGMRSSPNAALGSPAPIRPGGFRAAHSPSPQPDQHEASRLPSVERLQPQQQRTRHREHGDQQRHHLPPAPRRRGRTAPPPPPLRRSWPPPPPR